MRPGDTSSSIDLRAIRAAIDGGTGPAFWQSLDAVARTPAFQRFLQREYPAAAHLAKGPDRRGFFKLMAASFAMAGLAGCDDGEDGRALEIPYVRQPEGLEPGVPLTYTSATILDGYADGILVKTVNGRPIKIEGNPDHPWSRGGTDVFGQASILGLYDPTRSQSVRYLNRTSQWTTFQAAMLAQSAAWRAKGGQGLRLLTGPVTSPSLVAQVEALMKAMPKARWHMLRPPGWEARAAASRAVFGRSLEARWRFERAQVVVSFDGDFLDHGPGQAGLSRAFADARAASAAPRFLALHAAASTPNLTSAKADYHISAEPLEILSLVGELQAAIEAPPSAASASSHGASRREAWVARAAAALRATRGQSIVVAGSCSSDAVHRAVHRLNAALGNVGTTVVFTEPVLPAAESLSDLSDAMRAGAVSALVILDANPVYAAPGDLHFSEALSKVPLKIHGGLYVDETALRCDWHLPLAHALERWGDARSVDGTATLLQPATRPFYDGRSPAEILSLIFDAQPRDGLSLTRSHWQGSQEAVPFEAAWRKALIDGFFTGTALPEQTVSVLEAPPETDPGPPLDIRPDALTVLIRTDPTIWDGSFAANGWLQELSKPLTKIVWENVAAVSPALAQKVGIANGDIVSVAAGGRSVDAPAWIVPGQAARCVTLTLGYGRRVPEALFDELGYDAGVLRTADSPWMVQGASLTKTGRKAAVATTQDLHSMEGHDFVRIARADDAPIRHGAAEGPSLYGPPDAGRDGGATTAASGERAWGMVIDLDRCIGCNSCIVACQSENNIAIVGKDQVALGRGMHWLRVDRYYSSAKTAGNGLDDPDTHFQPVPCMHCELAPCEVGCPVEATLHDSEGLNLMVYNRCIGTRACSGYCPYKVRHFNYLDYSGGAAPSIQAGRNPDVSVRSRGVMEKCTYCVQRIAGARLDADKTGEPIKDGTVTTACQGACPTRAISFGDLADRASDVAVKRGDPRNYDLLGELNVRPRTTYLAERAPLQGAKEG